MATMLPNVPVLKTERLILRGPAPQDIEPVIAFYADPVRSAGFGGPLKRDDAWRWFALSVGHWCLHGYGFWTVETKGGEIVGIVGIWNPEGWPEPELGWVMFENGEGKGYAFEAGEAARNSAFFALNRDTLVSWIDPENARAIKLVERLGAQRDAASDIDGSVAYRYPRPEFEV